MNVTGSALDAGTLAGLQDLADGDQAFLNELFSMYIDQSNHTIADLRTSLERNDRIAFSRASHLLAGASLNVGAVFVADACRAIETAMAGEAARPAASQLRSVEDEVKRVIDAITMLAGA